MKVHPSESQLFNATGMGMLAIILWSFSACMNLCLHRIPVFETLLLIFIIGFVVAVFKISWQRKWAQMYQPPVVWGAGIVGVCGTQFAYFFAFRQAPAVHADLINFLWPIFILIFAGFLPKERFSAQHVVAGALGFCGIYVLMSGGEGLESFQWKYFSGYSWAFLDAFLWGGYNLFSRHYTKIPHDMVGLYYGIGVLIAVPFHINAEIFIVPNLRECLCLLISGGGISIMGCSCWEYGIKKGNFKLLIVCSYLIPVLSVGLLVLFGITELSFSLSIACLFVIGGSAIGSLPSQFFEGWLRKKQEVQT